MARSLGRRLLKRAFGMADIKETANALAAENAADVILINASMDRGNEAKFIEKCAKLCRRENAIVIIVTNGGDADVAYRIARCLQEHYKRITAIISGQCKSAGTLLAVGAHELAFSDQDGGGYCDQADRRALRSHISTSRGHARGRSRTRHEDRRRVWSALGSGGRQSQGRHVARHSRRGLSIARIRHRHTGGEGSVQKRADVDHPGA